VTNAFAVILPFLRPIEHLILDETITEIMVNGGNGTIFTERDGLLHREEAILGETSLNVAVKNIARALRQDISKEAPLLESRLPDGSRVAAALQGVSVGGTTLTIRKFQQHRYSTEHLVEIGSIEPVALDQLRRAVLDRHNILLSGGVGTGKTTLLNALCSFIPPDDRILLIEDTSEISIPHMNLVRLEARREQPGMPPITIRQLLKASLRHRPDRIIVGEVRGAEAFDLLDALNTGHSGSFSTIHADSAELAPRRLASCVLQAESGLPDYAIAAQIAESIHLIAHIERRAGRRLLTQMVRIASYDRTRACYELERLYRYQP
jgi:pilus assembly protein CpaF